VASVHFKEVAVTEPKAEATHVEQVVPGIWHWYVWDDRIGSESHAHAVSGEGGSVLIDPLPLQETALRSLEPIAAICLTAACHQRSAWRYRRTCGAKVHVPEGTREMEEEPDLRYREGDALPGGLKAINTPGPERAHFALWREQPPAVVFCPDLVMRGEGARSSLCRRSTTRIRERPARACAGCWTSPSRSSAWITERRSRRTAATPSRRWWRSAEPTYPASRERGAPAPPLDKLGSSADLALPNGAPNFKYTPKQAIAIDEINGAGCHRGGLKGS
jgi:hypothetical protein